jgi:cell division septal protein FtsQ
MASLNDLVSHMTLRTRILAFSAISFIALTYLFAWSPILTVKTISASGFPAGVSSESIVSKSGISVGEKMARIEPRSVEKLLGEMSWVKEVAVSRNWIKGDVAIAIEGRIPVGLYKGKAIDSSGTLFDMPGGKAKGLPTVSAATPELGLAAISLFTELPNDLRDSLISMSAANGSAITSWHRESGRNVKITWGSPKEVELKVSVYRALLLLPENTNIRSADLSAPHAPIVR